MPPKKKALKLGPYRLHAHLADKLEPIDAVKPHPRNPKRGDVPAIRESMAANGIYRPIYAQRDTGFIIAGRHTWQALKDAGAEQAPIDWLDSDNTESVRIRLADNRVAELGDMDEELLLANLDELDGLLEGTGYDEDFHEDLTARLAGTGPGFEDEVENDLPDTGELLALADVSWGEPKTEVHRHQVWALGDRHVLVIAKLTDEHQLWVHRLTDDVRFMPYPEPYITASDLANEHPLLLVQPNLFLAGHLIDKHKSLHPDDDVRILEEAAQ